MLLKINWLCTGFRSTMHAANTYNAVHVLSNACNLVSEIQSLATVKENAWAVASTLKCIKTILPIIEFIQCTNQHSTLLLLPYYYYPTVITLLLLHYYYYPTIITLLLLPYCYYTTIITLLFLFCDNYKHSKIAHVSFVFNSVQCSI